MSYDERRAPNAGELADDEADALPRPGGLVDRRSVERLEREPRLRLAVGQADHVRHLDLVRLAVRGRVGTSAREVEDDARALAVAVVEPPATVAEDDALSATRTGRTAPGTTRAARSSAASAFSMKALKISAGNVPPATGSPWYSVSIGFSVFG